ncbi:hypothetical protein [Jatrophihabitans fulvus]
MTDAHQDPDPLLTAVLNLSRFHRDHEKFYASAPREQAVTLQRHARTLQGLADRWSEVESSRRAVLSPYEAAEDLNAPDAVQLDGVLFLEDEQRPAELTRLVRDLRTQAEDAEATGAWLAAAMEASWSMASALAPIDGLADVLGERHRIIANDWQAADATVMAGRILHRAADLLDGTDLRPSAVRADLAGARVTSKRLYSIAEMLDHAAELSSRAAGAELDSERRWRTFRERVRSVVDARSD